MASTDPSPVRNIVSRFETKKEQSLDALPFRTVRSFFDENDRSIHVSQEKQKYDELMAKMRKEALERSPESRAARKRLGSSESPVAVDPLNNDDADVMVDSINSAQFTSDESNQVEEEENIPEPEVVEENNKETLPPPPPLPPADAEESELNASQIVNTPEQDTKKRPILTTERSFVMEEDHTIETEDMIVVGERISTDGEEDREELVAVLERELYMTEEDAHNIRDALESNPSSSRRSSVVKTHRYKRPENVPSKLHVPTAASLASRTSKNPASIKKESVPTPSKKPTVSTPTPKKNPYANVKSKVKEMINAPPATSRKSSDASDTSYSLLSPSSTKSSDMKTPRTKSKLQNGAASVDRRSFMSNSSRRSSSHRPFLNLHDESAHEDWEGRHRNERLSFASSTSSTDSSDPLALQLSFTKRKSRYDNVEPRYLDYSKSSMYSRNKEAQTERRKKLEQENAAKSADRQKQINFQQTVKGKRDKEDQEAALRRGEELHKLTKATREQEKLGEPERRDSLSAIRRALSSTSVEAKRCSPSSQSASSPRSSVLSEPDSTVLSEPDSTVSKETAE